MIIDQTRFRFFNDDGDEANSTPKANENTNLTAPRDENVRVRIQISATDDPAVENFQIQWKKTTDTTWRKLNPLI